MAQDERTRSLLGGRKRLRSSMMVNWIILSRVGMIVTVEGL
jgi:hypothetical protein